MDTVIAPSVCRLSVRLSVYLSVYPFVTFCVRTKALTCMCGIGNYVANMFTRGDDVFRTWLGITRSRSILQLINSCYSYPVNDFDMRGRMFYLLGRYVYELKMMCGIQGTQSPPQRQDHILKIFINYVCSITVTTCPVNDSNMSCIILE